MLRLFYTTTILVFLVSSPAHAGCEHYAGHIDLEGKIGNNRNIGEASAFLPVACTQDRLLFTDLKFRADNLSNREANIGLGARVQREDGIAGGYIYFDRKKSGETDKFYNQITTGAEFLADHWETRANVYIPLNRSKTIGNGVVVSDPYLAGSGIFIDRGGFQIKETPMYGADAEIGFQTTENLWLYGGGFTFHANDVPAITGARVRAKYDLTEKVSLNAEGQYDDERGRQGWLGARLSIPFGTATATRSRMTQSPVRDVDIVTQAKVTHEPQTTTALANPDSGDAQRIIYVDNRAAANGDGSLENPYNTLGDAQGDLRDYDIVYLFHGNGTTTGQDQGFVIDKNNVSFIGEGSPLTFAGYTLRQAQNKPLITTNAGNGISVRGANPTIKGLQIENALGNAISITETSGSNMGNVKVENLSIANSNGWGITIVSRAAGSNIETIDIRNVEVSNTSSGGIRAIADGGGSIGTLAIHNASAIDTNGTGFWFSAGSSTHGPGTIDEIILDTLHAVNNSNYGFYLRSREVGSTVGIFSLINAKSISNGNSGIQLASNASGHIDEINIFDSTIDNNRGSAGLQAAMGGNNSINKLNIKNTDIINNYQRGLQLTDTANPFNIDIDMNGNNRIFGNGRSNPATYGDLHFDLPDNPIAIDARNNWWGQEEGPVAGQIRPQSPPDSGTIIWTDWLETDPRP